MGEVVVEVWHFLDERKKVWLLPRILMLIVLSGLMVLTSGSVVAPFIYTIEPLPARGLPVFRKQEVSGD